MAKIKLQGKLIISGVIRVVTGLHIGGASTGLEIGGVDNIVLRNPWDNQPYIPGSSLKGKMRSLLERTEGLDQNEKLHSAPSKVSIHKCEEQKHYKGCIVCRLFGVAGDTGLKTAPTRLYVRDIRMKADDVQKLEALDTDLPYTEVKWEAAIDRVTAAAVPRQTERVPAGVTFEPMELVFNFYQLDGYQLDGKEASNWICHETHLLQKVFEALRLVQDDYLGGMGSRGYGQVAFEQIKLELKGGDGYNSIEWHPNGGNTSRESADDSEQEGKSKKGLSLDDLVKDDRQEQIKKWIIAKLAKWNQVTAPKCPDVDQDGVEVSKTPGASEVESATDSTVASGG